MRLQVRMTMLGFVVHIGRAICPSGSDKEPKRKKTLQGTIRPHVKNRQHARLERCFPLITMQNVQHCVFQPVQRQVLKSTLSDVHETKAKTQ